jgi:nitrate/nitrite transporter NarK
VSVAELARIQDQTDEPTEERTHDGRVPWTLLFHTPALRALCVMYVCAIYGWYFYLTWFPTYLIQARGLDLSHAGTLSSLPLIGIALGVFGGGLASDRLALAFGSSARRWCGIIGFPLAAFSTFLGVTATSPVEAALLLSAAAGLGAAGVAPAWAVCLEIGGEHAGVISGAMNMFGNLGGTLCPVIVGMCVKRLSSWPAALATVAVLYLVAAVAWIFVDPDTP